MNWYSVFWLWWNKLAFVPLITCTILRIFIEDKKKKNSKSSLDLIVRVILSGSLIYYVFDSIYIIFQINRYGWCNFGYFSHHIISLFGIREIVTLPYYPWFLILPFAFHCLLLMYPLISFFNYVYFVSMVNCLYRLRLKP